MRAFLAVSLLVMWSPAHAESEMRWVKRWHCEPTYGYCTWTLVQRRVYYRPSYAYRRDYNREDDRYDARGLCKDRNVEVISTEHTTEDHARDAARKLWMASVQWRDGSRFMDLENARDVLWRCGPSNAMDTMSGRISETTAKLVGRDGQNVRCQLMAIPCEVARERDRDHRR